MPMRCLVKATGAAALALSIAHVPAVQADESGLYVGAEDLTHVRIKVKRGSLRAAGLTAPGTHKDESETGYRFYAGYRFNPYLALEGGYAVLGDFMFESPAPGGTLRVNSMEVDAFNLDVLARWPVWNDFSVHARAGFVRSKTDVSVTATGAAVTPRNNLTDKDWGYHIGVGAGWDPHSHVGVRVGWERYRVSDGLGGDAGVNLISWGIQVRF